MPFRVLHRPFSGFADERYEPGGVRQYTPVRRAFLVVPRHAYDSLPHARSVPGQPPRYERPRSRLRERQRFTRGRLMALFAGAGIRVLRCSYANSLLMPVALAKFRLWEPLTGTPAASGVQPVAPWLDDLLHVALAAEARWLGAGYNLA